MHGGQGASNNIYHAEGEKSEEVLEMLIVGVTKDRCKDIYKKLKYIPGFDHEIYMQTFR